MEQKIRMVQSLLYIHKVKKKIRSLPPRPSPAWLLLSLSIIYEGEGERVMVSHLFSIDIYRE